MSERPIEDGIDTELRSLTKAFADASPRVPEFEDLFTVVPEEMTQRRLTNRRFGTSPRTLLAMAAVIIAIAGVFGLAVLVPELAEDRPAVITDGDGEKEQSVDIDPVPIASVPEALFAAEAFAATPSAARLTALLDVLGGLDGIELGNIEGAYDIVTIDPLNTDRVLLTKRDVYIRGESNGMNQDENILWEWKPDGATSALFRPDLDHDSATFNRDGTVTLWVVAGSIEGGLQPRRPVVLDTEGAIASEMTEAIFHQRWAVDAGVMLALVWGDPTTFDGHGGGSFDQLMISNGDSFTAVPRNGTEWVDTPMPGIVMAAAGGVDQPTRVWDTSTVQQLDNHPLAGRTLVRVAVSGDGTTALAVDLEGALVVIDMATGALTDTIGSVDVENVAVPLAISDDGSVAITTEQNGNVTIWWVPEGEAIATFPSESSPHRELTNVASTRVTSAAALDATRVVRQHAPRPDVGITWTVLDTDVDSWLQRACVLAGRPLTPDERAATRLPGGPGVCG